MEPTPTTPSPTSPPRSAPSVLDSRPRPSPNMEGHNLRRLWPFRLRAPEGRTGSRLLALRQTGAGAGWTLLDLWRATSLDVEEASAKMTCRRYILCRLLLRIARTEEVCHARAVAIPAAFSQVWP